MNNFRKTISILLSLCLFAGHIAFAKPYDVEDEYLMKVLNTLGSFGILYEQGSMANFRPDDTVTRGEAVSDILKLSGNEIRDFGEEEEKFFSDVDENNEYFNEIQTAFQEKIIVGYGSQFRPESNITYSELAKMLLIVLGYENVAENNGGYSVGYNKIASQINLNKNVNSVTGDVSRRNYAVILYNALTTPLMMLSGEGGMISSEENTLLTEKHNAVLGKGVVTADSYSTLYSARGIGEGYVEIDGKRFSAGDADCDELLGCYVEYVAAENEYGDRILKGIWADENRITEINSKNILKEKCDFDIIYAENEEGVRSKKYVLANNVDLIYNGQARDFNDINLIVPACGKLRLSDTDNNGVYDIVSVTDYTIRIAYSVSESNNMIIFKDNCKDELGADDAGIRLDDDNYNAYTIEKDGKEIAITEIAEWDVLHIAKPVDPATGKLSIIVTAATVSGNLRQKGPEEITINDFVYKINKAYPAFRMPMAKLGQQVSAMLDMFGCVIDFQNLSETNLCGFLYKVAYRERDDKVVFTIFSENGEWIKVESAEKIKLNDQSLSSINIVEELQCDGDADGVKVCKEDNEYKMIDIWGRYIDRDAATGAFVTVQTGVKGNVSDDMPTKITDRQLVIYSLDKNGQINQIYTEKATDDSLDFVMHIDYSRIYADKNGTPAFELQYRPGTGAFYRFTNSETSDPYPLFYADADSVLFLIPFDNPDDKELYGVTRGDTNFLTTQNDYNCHARAYGFERDLWIKGLPYMMIEAGGESSSVMVLIERVVETLDEDNMPVCKVKGYRNGAEVEYIVKNREAIIKANGERLKFGDWAIFYLNSDGTVKSIWNRVGNDEDGYDIIYNTSVPWSDQMGAFGTMRSSFGTAIGKVTAVDYTKNRIQIWNGHQAKSDALNRAESDAEYETTHIFGLKRAGTATRIYVVDTTEKTIRLGSINDITIGDNVVFQLGSGAVAAIAVYN